MSRRLSLLLCAALAGIGLSAQADTVYLIENGRFLEGKVLRETDEYIVLLVHNEEGQIRIPKDKIKKIEYDIKSQLANLDDDDYAGRYKVGVWAEQKGMFKEAIGLLESLRGKTGVGDDLDKLLGQAYDKEKQFDKALKCFLDYMKTHPDDKEIDARVKELLKVVNPEAAGGPQKAPPSSGYAGTGTWTSEGWKDVIPSAVQITTDPTGKKVLAIASKGATGQQQKMAITRTDAPFELIESDTKKEYKEMLLRVSSDAKKPINMAVAFVNGNGEYFESRGKAIPGNKTWTDISFKLEGTDFKTQATNWEHKAALTGKEKILRFTLLCTEHSAFNMWIDGIFFK